MDGLWNAKIWKIFGVHSFFVVYIKQRYMEWCTFKLHKTNTEGIDEWNSYIQETEWQPVLEKEIILDFNGQFEMMAKEISIQIQLLTQGHVNAAEAAANRCGNRAFERHAGIFD